MAEQRVGAEINHSPLVLGHVSISRKRPLCVTLLKSFTLNNMGCVLEGKCFLCMAEAFGPPLHGNSLRPNTDITQPRPEPFEILDRVEISQINTNSG